MKASKFSDAQKVFILKQGADGIPVTDICRKAGISQATNGAGSDNGTGAECDAARQRDILANPDIMFDYGHRSLYH